MPERNKKVRFYARKKKKPTSVPKTLNFVVKKKFSSVPTKKMVIWQKNVEFSAKKREKILILCQKETKKKFNSMPKGNIEKI